MVLAASPPPFFLFDIWLAIEAANLHGGHQTVHQHTGYERDVSLTNETERGILPMEKNRFLLEKSN